MESPATGTANPSDASVEEWSGLLDFPIGDDDLLFLPWSGPEARPAQPPPPPGQSSPAPAGGSADRARKRDPRLVCSNFLAGRIPCECPEADAMAAEAEEEEERLEAAAAAGAVGGGAKRARRGTRGGVMVGAVRCQVPGCEADISELKGYHRRHRVCLCCAYAPAVVLEGESKRYCQQCGKFHLLTDFDEGKRSCRRKLDRHNKRRRRRPTDLLTMVKNVDEPLGDISPVGNSRKENGFTCETVVRNKVMDKEALVEFEDGRGSPLCSLNSFDNVHGNSVVSLATTSDEAQREEKVDNSKSALSSAFCDNKNVYSSVCPTGRISFKLYDWNPAEFPRRLRHQIFQWLASMPVELEGYIRPGCTILTVFIAMPRFMWEKISQDAAHYLTELIYAPESLFLGRGNIHIYLSNMIVQVLKDGSSLTNIKMEIQAPRLHYVYPTFFEAGKSMEFIACGSNLNQPKFRFLVSFAEKYLALESCHAISHGKMKAYHGNGVDPIFNHEHEMFRIKVSTTDSEVFGPAFIEVENKSGISNFVPVLVGNKHICSELENMCAVFSGSLHANSMTNALPDRCEAFVSSQAAMSGLLLDIAWMLKKPLLEKKEALLNSAYRQGFTYLMKFLIHNEFFSLLEQILYYLDIIDGEGSDSAVLETSNADLKLFLNTINKAREILVQRSPHDATSGTDSRESCFTAHCAKSYSADDVNAMNSTDQVAERRNNDGLGLMTTPATEENDGTIPLLVEERTQRQICFPLVGVRLRQDSWSNIFPVTITSIRFALILTAGLVMCFMACVLLLHPDKAGGFAVSLRRHLFP